MNVAPEQFDEYLRIEREVWLPIHRALIRDGKKRSWILYQVQMPFGTGSEYPFVTVNVCDSLSDLDAIGPDAIADVVARVHPQLTLDPMMAETFAARDLVRGELWRRLEHVE